MKLADTGECVTSHTPLEPLQMAFLRLTVDKARCSIVHSMRILQHIIHRANTGEVNAIRLLHYVREYVKKDYPPPQGQMNMTEEKKPEGVGYDFETIGNESARAQAETLSMMHSHTSSLVRPYCLGFRELDIGASVVRTWETRPDIIFRPMGLMTWGCKNESRMLSLYVGNERHVMASSDAIPLRFFEPGFTFKEFVELLEKDTVNDPRMDEAWTFFMGWLEKRPDVTPRQLFSLPTVTPANTIRIETKGPLGAMVLWGMAATL